MTATILIIAACLLAEGFFSGAEIALVNVNRLRISHKAQQGDLGARTTLRFLEHPEMLLGTSLVGNNLCVITGTMTATLFLLERFGDAGAIYAILIYWPLTFILGEIIPKTVYQANADRAAPVAAMVLRIFYLALYPAIWLLTRFAFLLTRFLRKKGRHEPAVTRSDVKALARSYISSDIDVEEKRMIRRMIDFASARVSDVMIPLIDVMMLEAKMTAGDAAALSTEHRFSRFPVYRDRVDQIVGVADTSSLLNLDSPSDPLRKYMRKPVFVPETMSVKALLEELRHRGVSMAIVVDEYGGAVGIITLEDVLEEVLGNIEDEFDVPGSFYRKIGPASFIFQARTEVSFINEHFDFRIREGQYETLGGFLLERFDRIPRHNETLTEGRLKFTVLNPTDRALTEVLVDLMPAEDEDN